MPPPRTPRTMVRIEAAGQIHKQVQCFTHLGGAVTETPDMSVEIARRTRVCWMCIRWYLRELYDHATESRAIPQDPIGEGQGPVGQNQRGGWSKVVLVALEAVSAGSKPPVAVRVRISAGKRHGFGAAAPLSTKTSSQRGRAGSPAFMPKLVELVGPAWTLFAEQLSPCFACTAAAVPSVRSQVFLSAVTSAPLARRGYRASCSRLAERCFVTLIASINSFNFSFC